MKTSKWIFYLALLGIGLSFVDIDSLILLTVPLTNTISTVLVTLVLVTFLALVGMFLASWQVRLYLRSIQLSRYPVGSQEWLRYLITFLIVPQDSLREIRVIRTDSTCRIAFYTYLLNPIALDLLYKLSVRHLPLSIFSAGEIWYVIAFPAVFDAPQVFENILAVRDSCPGIRNLPVYLYN